MTEQRPDSDPGELVSSAGPAENFSSNGSYPEGGIAIAEPVVDAEASAADTEAIATEAATGTAAETTDDPVAVATDATEAETTVEEAPAAADEGATFIDELVRAMQTTAAAERQRLDEDADRRREAHLAAIEARRQEEAGKMLELAAEDKKAIDEWAEAERQRIDTERDRRAAALQEDLQTSLSEHASMIEKEIAAVESAVDGYRTELASFFATLNLETDPVAIARHASRRPVFPTLETVSPDVEATTAAATDFEQPAVGVMDPEASAPVAEPWSGWTDQPLPAESVAEPIADPVAEATAEEPVVSSLAAEPEVSVLAPDQPASPSLLQSVAVSRPMAWLRGDRNEDH